VLQAAREYLVAATEIVEIADNSVANAFFQKEIKSIGKMINGYSSALANLHVAVEEAQANKLKILESRYSLLSESLGASLEKVRNMEADLSSVSTRLLNLQEPAKEQFKSLAEFIKIKTDEIGVKSGQYDNLLSLVSGDAVARSYKQSSEKEKSAADALRIASLVCMIVAVYFLISGFRSGEDGVFDIPHIIANMIQATVLTIPAGYLARESTKHRKQYYMLMQTALDIEAITPYTASLPEEFQHKLKRQIAAKIFSPKNFDDVTKESLPINAQELMTLVLGKIKEIDLQPRPAKKSKKRIRSREKITLRIVKSDD